MGKSAVRYCFLFLCLCSVTLVSGQDYSIEISHFSIKEGLSDREIICLLQDRQGFIWIGTRAGLNRFDGYKFRIWTKDDGLSSDCIQSLFEDAYGFICVSDCTGAIYLIDPEQLTLSPINTFYGDKIPGGIKADGMPYFLSKDSTLYLSNPRSIRTFHPRRGYQEVPIQAADSNHVFTPRYVSAANTIWGELRGAARWDVVELNAKGEVLQQFNDPSKQGGFLGTGRHMEASVYYSMGSGAEAKCLEIFPDNTTRLVDKSLIFPYFGKQYGAATLALVNKDGPLYSEFQFFDLQNSTPLVNLIGTYDGVGGGPRGLMFDRSGKLWMGSRLGVFVADIQRNHFRRLLNTREAGVLPLSCRGILEQDGHLMVNTEAGVYCDGMLIKASNPAPWPKGLNTPWFGLGKDQKGRLWTAAFGMPLGQLQGYPPSLSLSLASYYYPWSIYPDNQDRLWIGTGEGLHVYDIAAQKTTRFTQFNGFDELYGASIIDIQADRAGQIWLSANTGFYRLDLDKGIMERHWSGVKDGFYLPASNFAHFYEDADGVFWLATLGSGMIRWDRKNGHIVQYSKKNGLSNNTIYAVYEDEHQHLWLPSDEGIIQFDKTTGTVRRVYLVEDGITQNEFNRTSHFRGRDGTLYFGGLNGITAFQPNDFYGNEATVLPSLVVSKYNLLAGDRYQLEDKTSTFLEQNEIVLYPGFRYFELEFALLAFTKTSRIQYFYKIEGLDQDWVTQTENHLRINYLPYGTFHLRIRAKGSDGLWGANELDIPVHVIRPFWLTWWFFLLCIMAVAAVVYAWFQYRLLQAIKIERLRVQISSDLHDDVGTMLAGLAMQSEALELSAREKDKSKLRRVSEISRNAMAHMRDTVWAIDARKDQLENLLDRMREHAEETLTPRDIRFDIQVDNLSLKQTLPTNIRQNLYLIYKEAVTNVARHSNADTVSVSLQKSADGVEMCIADNGKPTAKAYKTSGLGTSNMQMRAEKMGGKLEISWENGYCVRVRLRDLS